MSGSKNYATIKAIPVLPVTHSEIVSVPHDRVQWQEDKQKTKAPKTADKSARTGSAEPLGNSKRATA